MVLHQSIDKCQALLKHFEHLESFSLQINIANLENRHQYFHFTDEETEIQGGDLAITFEILTLSLTDSKSVALKLCLKI